MTIDEAIEHATQVADSYKDTAPDCDYVKDQRQLAEWLKKARIYEKVKKMSVSMIRKLKEENAKLRTQLADVTESMGRVEERCAKLRAERDEWHRVAVSKQDIVDHMRDARAENDKLRELAQDYDKCLDTALCLAHGAGYPVMPDQKLFDSLRPRMRKLGIEVTP